MTTSFKTLLSLIVSGLALAAPSLRAATIQVSNADITGTVNWYRTNTYVLNGFVFVQNGEVLNIEAGTVIKGAVNATPATIAALVVARGGKIYANGTANSPIIMTSVLDDEIDPLDQPLFQRGLWGGLVIMGRARINTANLSAGNNANPKYDLYEGLPQQEEFLYGGNDDDDDSGVIRYVSIRHGGKVLESNKEINGLSLCGVGRGTKIEFVECYGIADDGFEFFGGSVNTRYLVSAFNDDDVFDTDQGWRGRNQFWFGIQEPGVRDKGMELNGEPQGLSVGNLPLNAWEAYNVTLIGAGASSGGSGNNAFTIRDYASPSIYNSIFTEFAQRGMSMDASAGGNLDNGTLNFANNLWFGFTGGVNPNSATNLGIDVRAQILWTDTARSNLIVSPMLRGISRTNNGALDPRPAPGSPALAGLARTAPNNGFYTPTDYVGAFGTNGLWLSTWTALSYYGVITPDGGRRDLVSGGLLPSSLVQVANANITGTVNWYRTNTYVLNGFVFVQNGEVLNIEAGTVIKGAPNATPATIAALVVARGGRIHANGTAQNPIIFTALSDDLDDPLDLPVYQRGLWGGVVLMGNARINTANLSAGNNANPKYDLYEGLPQQEEFLYGGNDDDDSSGSLCYVSIRHGGKVLESNKEINGLSLCGVGRGTTIDFVESYGIADDGFEFFGGSVNTRYLVSAFNDDDVFDTDQGWRGRNQFWFGIQEPGVRDKGMELNGEPQGLSVGNLPLNAWEAYNVTLIGAGAGSGGSGNNAFTIRDYASPSIYNSIFTEFAQRGMSMDASAGGNLDNGTLNFANNLWFGFTGGVNPNSATNLGIDVRAQILWTDTARSNLIVSPMLRGISRAGFAAALDPRPQVASPALAGNGRTVPNNGVYAPAAHQGAFGAVNWAVDWTALATYGVLTGAGGGVASHVTVVVPPQPILGAALSSGDIVISFATVTGASYQVQSTTLLVNGGTLWTDEGAPMAGTGGTVNYSAPASAGAKYFRVVAQ